MAKFKYQNTYQSDFSSNFKKKIESALVGTLLQQSSNLANPYLAYSVATKLAKTAIYLAVPYVSTGNILQSKKNLDFTIALSESQNKEEDGRIASNVLIDNFTLKSKYVDRNFFDQTLNVQEEISIPILIGEVNVQYNNNYADSAPIGYAGTIKEWIGSSNYNINISGLFFTKWKGDDVNNPTQNFPDLSDFVKMCVKHKTCSVISDFIQEKTLIDLSECVILSFDLPSDSTEKNIQRFTLTLQSDKLINIK